MCVRTGQSTFRTYGPWLAAKVERAMAADAFDATLNILFARMTARS